MTSPEDLEEDLSDWILRNPIGKGKVVTVNYNPPIVAQHVAVFRFDQLELALSEVMVYGKFHSK